MFHIYIDGGCEVTYLVFQNIELITVDINDSKTVELPEFQDGVSIFYGDGSGTDLCGSREYAIYETDYSNGRFLPRFVEINQSETSPPSITITPNSPSLVGVHEMSLEVSLRDYDS